MTPPSRKLEHLLREAGHRPEPDAQMLERLRAATHAAWQAQLAERRRQRQRWFAIAASLLLVAVGGLLMIRQQDSVPAMVVASMDGRLLRAGEEVTAPAAGLVLLRMPQTGTSLRLAPGTRLRWRTAEAVELLAGRIYVDTGHESDALPLRIEAGPVSIMHVGTQFVAERLADGVQVLVRDGVVRMSRGNDIVQLSRGETAKASFASGTAIERTVSASSGEAWSWADALAPPLLVEGRDLRSVLQEMAYQAGFTLRFDQASIESRAAGTMLHGPAIELPPTQALHAVLATSDLRVLPASSGDDVLIGPR